MLSMLTLDGTADIFAGIHPPVYFYGVIKSGQGILKRGTILVKNEAGKLEKASDLEEDTIIAGILADDVDTTNGDVQGQILVHGEFDAEKLIATGTIPKGSYNYGTIIIK